MSWFKAISAAIGGFFRGKGGELVDDAILTEQERKEFIQADTRASYDLTIDSLSRTIRPGITIMLIGGVFNWWTLPDPEHLGDFWQNVLMLVLTFWFGGRVMLKELPIAVRAMRGFNK